jgi:hypothetical protein
MIARGMTPQKFASDYFASAKSGTGGRGNAGSFLNSEHIRDD